MKITKGRINALPVIFKHYLDDTIMINLTKEKITIFYDGSYKQTKKKKRRD
jgi:hypothetical protein